MVHVYDLTNGPCFGIYIVMHGYMVSRKKVPAAFYFLFLVIFSRN
jgi:hypothetical protein